MAPVHHPAAAGGHVAHGGNGGFAPPGGNAVGAGKELAQLVRLLGGNPGGVDEGGQFAAGVVVHQSLQQQLREQGGVAAGFQEVDVARQ